jgi:lysyl-tRNA synthetase class 2
VSLHARGQLVQGLRAFFESRGFLEVETPIVVASPGLDVHLDAFALAPPHDGRPQPTRFLSTSPEYQMKRLLSGASGMARIFQLTKAFRQDELGSRHNPEFSMLEWYRAPADVDDVMRDTEQLVARITKGLVVLPGRTISTLPPFRRLTVVEAFATFAGTSADETFGLATHDEDRFYRLLVEKVEPALEALDHAVFLTEYPVSQASLARAKPSDPRVAERFELYVAGLELCNGFGELTDAREQRARLEQDQATRAARGLPVYPIDERFLRALEAGVPPCSGNALGVDRLIALACGTQAIADVMAFTAETL